MEILPIYSKKQEEKLRSAGLDLNMIYLLDTTSGQKIPKEKWNTINKHKLGSLAGIVNFLQEVEETKLKIEPALCEILTNLQCQANDKYIGEILAKAIKSPSWRERATIMNITGRMYNARFANNLLKAAVSVELMQEAFMLRDDILDEQDRCVNHDTIPVTYGRTTAELAKDILLSESRNIMLETENCEVMSLLEEMIKNDALGQWIDMKSETQPYENELVEKYYEMISLTPGTQFKNISVIAHILSGKNDRKEIEALQNWGLRFGMAAQLRDDIIDIIGDEEVVYKKLGTDILRRKKRLPMILLQKHHNYYSDLSQNEAITERTVDEARTEMVQHKIIDECITEINDWITAAIAFLRILENNEGINSLKDCSRLLTIFD